jgi:hypothetical protein
MPSENLKFTDHSFQQTQFKNKSYNPGLSDLSGLRIDAVMTEPSQNYSSQVANVRETSSSPGIGGGFWSSL